MAKSNRGGLAGSRVVTHADHPDSLAPRCLADFRTDPGGGPRHGNADPYADADRVRAGRQVANRRGDDRPGAPSDRYTTTDRDASTNHDGGAGHTHADAAGGDAVAHAPPAGHSDPTAGGRAAAAYHADRYTITITRETHPDTVAQRYPGATGPTALANRDRTALSWWRCLLPR